MYNIKCVAVHLLLRQDCGFALNQRLFIMDKLDLSAALMCCSAYKNDPLIHDFCGIFCDNCEGALRSYSAVCERLLSENLTLSDYIFFLAAGGGNPLINAYISSKSDILYKSVSSDIAVLAEIASKTPQELSGFICERFPEASELHFPEFETGKTAITTESVISYAERFGSRKFAENKAFSFENGELIPVRKPDPIRLSDLKNYRVQREKIIDNTLCFLNGKKAHNALLYGDRGTGKSSTVKALVNQYPTLRIIQIPKREILNIYRIYGLVQDNPLKFILFIDDITFGENDEGYSFLKQVLEGSVVAMPDNCILYATTNRRHILKETVSERSGDEMHAADARDENMSLADRFGLYITFSTPAKSEFLDIVHQIAADRDIELPEDKLDTAAERFALKKCGRSPRTARQFIDMLQSRLELGLDYENL